MLLKNGSTSAGTHRLAVPAGQLQLLLSVLSNLAASPVSSWAEFKSWLPSGPNLRPAFPMSNMLWVQQQSLCAWGTHSLARSPSGTGVVDPCRQSHQPALRDAANPLLWARIYCFSTSSEWSGCFCLPSSLSPGFHPNKRRKETEKAVRQWQERISD